MRKRISIDRLKPGMYLVGINQVWLKTPFWIHRGLVKNQEDIRRFKATGIRTVFIDTGRGVDDVENHDSHTQSEPIGEGSPAKLYSCEMDEKGKTFGETASFTPSSREESLSGSSFKEKLTVVRDIRVEAVGAVERVFEGIKTGVPITAEGLKGVTQTLLHSLLNHTTPMLTEIHLQRMQQFNHSLFTHSVDVCVLSLVVGIEAKLSLPQLQELATGALLHDVGQMRLPRNTLQKSGPFTHQERKLFENHPQLGSRIILQTEGVSRSVQRIVSEHHERIDGSGYPWGRMKSQIFPLAQLVGLVDRYDALVSTRGRRPATPPALAVRRIYQLGINGKFDMDWVERLIRCVSIYPIGSLVELNTGERGWVVAVNQEDRMRPTVRLMWDPKLKRMAEPVQVELSGAPDSTPARKIHRVLNPIVEGIREDFHQVMENT